MLNVFLTEALLLAPVVRTTELFCSDAGFCAGTFYALQPRALR